MTEDKKAEVIASFERNGFLRLIGATIIELSLGNCTIAAGFSDVITQQDGYFHGGAIGAIADVAGGYAAMSLLPLGSDVLSAEYKINFLRPAKGERLVAIGSVLKPGKTLLITRADVFCERGGKQTLCAAMQQTIIKAPNAPT